tara:strand:+ start:76 stop:1296 length:1221 start_codon:yes stop_codon:yes gene_type:complete
MERNRDDFVIAIRSAFLKKGTQQRFSLLALIFFSITFLILGSINYKPIDNLKKLLRETVYLSSFIVSIPENLVGKSYINISNHFSHYDEYKKIKKELGILKLIDLNNQILNLENIKYKRLVDDYFIKDKETFAKVLIDKQSPFLRSIIINKGMKNNIKIGMVILDEGYLVGKVIEVNYFTSRVLLISDINSKIPVSIQPGDIQAIMSGKDKQKGVLQYIKSTDLKNNNQEFKVLTSGAGEVFKNGIPIGEITIEENNFNKDEKIVNFYKDFSQLKYVKVVSYSKEEEAIDYSSKSDLKEQDEIIKKTQQKDKTLKILKEEKKIASEIRAKIEEENNILKNRIIKLKNELITAKKIIEKNENKSEEIKYLELKVLYGNKCKKNFFNKLHKVDSKEYKACVLNKGLKN